MAASALQEVIKDFVAESRIFDVAAVLAEVKHRAGLDDSMTAMLAGAVRWELVRNFESGNMIGYYLATRFSIGSDGKMWSALEFRPSKPFDMADEMVRKPENPVKVTCTIDRRHNTEINTLAEKYGVPKDTILRVMLLRSLDKLED